MRSTTASRAQRVSGAGECRSRTRDQIAHRRQIAGMTTAVNPSYDTVLIDCGCSGKLPCVAQLRLRPILRKARRVILGAPRFQRGIRQKVEPSKVAEAHRAIRAFIDVTGAARGGTVCLAESVGFLLRADRDERDAQVRVRIGPFELPQLRERFSEERSTDVSEPYDEPGKRRVQLPHISRRWISGVKMFLLCHTPKGSP